MTEAIVWAVVWLVLAFVGSWIIYAIGAFGGVALAAVTDQVWIAPVLIIAGWVGAVAWFIFGIVQTVLQIISVVRIAGAA